MRPRKSAVANPAWSEYRVVVAHLERLDPEVLQLFPALAIRLTKRSAELYVRALMLAHGRRVPPITWRKHGGSAHYRKHSLCLDPNPALGLVLHEVAHLLTLRVSLDRSYRVKSKLASRVRGRTTYWYRRPKFASKAGHHVHHGPAFARQLAELIREVL